MLSKDPTLRTARKPSQRLRDLYLKRRADNANYSLRAFARDLGMSQSLLSFILNEKRHLSLEQATRIAILLQMPSNEQHDFIQSVLQHLPKEVRSSQLLRKRGLTEEKASTYEYDAELMKLISKWHHFAIMDLATTRDFKNNAPWIARRLGISIVDAKDAIERMVSLDLMEKQNGKLRKTHQRVAFSNSKFQAGNRAFHQSILEKTMNELKKTSEKDFNQRYVGGMTLAIQASKREIAFKRLDAFKNEMRELMATDSADEVYHLELAFIPMSKRASS